MITACTKSFGTLAADICFTLVLSNELTAVSVNVPVSWGGAGGVGRPAACRFSRTALILLQVTKCDILSFRGVKSWQA